MNIPKNNIVSICRACRTISDNMYSIFFYTEPELAVSVADMLLYCTFKVTRDDGLPDTICKPCLEALKTSYKFHISFNNSAVALNQQKIESKQCDSKVELGIIIENNFVKLESPLIELQENETIKLEFCDSDSASAIKVDNSENIDNHICALCSKTFKSSKMFTRHINKHEISSQNKSKIYSKHQCKICNKWYDTKISYIRHMRRHKTKQKFHTCPVKTCNKSFVSKQSLVNHTTVHNSNKNYLCSLCGVSFRTADALRYHTKKHEGPSHLCTYCGKRYLQASHLSYHMWRHTGIKPYCCKNCGKSYMAKQMLQKHTEKCKGIKQCAVENIADNWEK